MRFFNGGVFENTTGRLMLLPHDLHTFTVTLMEVAGAKETSKNNMITFSN